MVALICFVLAALACHSSRKAGLPRIHGELLKLGFSVAQSTVATYMVKRRGPPCQGWRTFLRNHAPDIAAMGFFVVPTIGFKLLYGFVRSHPILGGLHYHYFRI
jgi:hypothetical protein